MPGGGQPWRCSQRFRFFTMICKVNSLHLYCNSAFISFVLLDNEGLNPAPLLFVPAYNANEFVYRGILLFYLLLQFLVLLP